MAIIGAILGDIAGSQYEFKRPKDPKKCEIFTNKCRYTDDTAMTLAAKLAVKDNMDFAEAYRWVGLVYPNAGYGERFCHWLEDENMGPYNSFGNGSAMRCSYIGEYFNTEKEVKEWAKLSAICTHNHPEGIKGAVVTATCIYMARTGASKQEILNYVASEYPKDKYKYSIEHELKSYRDNYKWDVTCMGSVPVAIRCFIESEDYETFIRNVYTLRCDMDTMCAIGGGIAEEFYKGTGFPNEKLLARYLDSFLYSIVKI